MCAIDPTPGGSTPDTPDIPPLPFPPPVPLLNDVPAMLTFLFPLRGGVSFFKPHFARQTNVAALPLIQLPV